MAGKNIAIVVVFFACLLGLVGCAKEDLSIEDGETPIRILTSIEMSYPSPSGTRSTVVEDGTQYDEEENEGSENENTIGTVRILAFDETTKQVVVNMLYRKPGVPVETGENNYALTGDGTDITNIQMDLRIASGRYEFILIANEEPSWNLSSISSYSQFTSSAYLKNFLNTIVTEADLSGKVSDNSGAPMIGSEHFIIPFRQTATESNPQVINPSIELKRNITKVEVNLTNINSSTGDVYTYADNYTIKSVGLYQMNQRYNVLEDDNGLITETNDHLVNTISHTPGAPFPNQQVLTAYMAERKNISSETATYIEIKTDKLGQEVVYDIPLYRLDGTEKDYNIYRNYLYRVNCVLNGTEMPYIEMLYSVGDWNLIEKYTLMGYDYNIEVSDVNFAGETNQITVYNTVKVCSGQEIELETKAPVTFSDGTSVKTFSKSEDGARESYSLNKNGAVSGNVYLIAKHNGAEVKRFTIE